jgi:hypothetical protein
MANINDNKVRCRKVKNLLKTIVGKKSITSIDYMKYLLFIAAALNNEL